MAAFAVGGASNVSRQLSLPRRHFESICNEHFPRENVCVMLKILHFSWKKKVLCVSFQQPEL
jgi:hypothetical protein